MTVEIENLSGVDLGLTRAIVEAVALPDSVHTLVVLGESDLDDEDFAGVCAPRFVLEQARPIGFTKRRHHRWDVGIALSVRTCSRLATLPAYFTQVLAHEFGHAHVAVSDPALHVYCSFIDENIRAVSNDRVNQWHQLPHEQTHDRFGILVAERLCGRKRLEDDWQVLLADEDRTDRNRLRLCEALTGTDDRSSLRYELATFASPYTDGLCEEWSRQSAAAAAAGGKSVTRLAPHIRELWGDAT